MPALSIYWDRYVELQREGERLGYAGDALGRYIARRLTDAQLLAMLRDYYRTIDQNRPPGGSTK